MLQHLNLASFKKDFTKITIALFAIYFRLLKMAVLMKVAVRTPEMFVHMYKTARRYNPEDSHLRTRQKNLECLLPSLLFYILMQQSYMSF
jgi:hypothetical protein